MNQHYFGSERSSINLEYYFTDDFFEKLKCLYPVRYDLIYMKKSKSLWWLTRLFILPLYEINIIEIRGKK